jgi:tetratricopeptide (TPR) repeat protein
VVISGSLGVLGAGLWFGLGRAEQKRERGSIRKSLPETPETEGWPATFTEALREAESEIFRRRSALVGVKELAMLFHANGFLDEAASCYRILEEREPGEPRWPYFQALLSFDRGDLASGQKHLVKTLALSPNAIHAILKLGDAQVKSNQPEPALDTFQSCLRLDSNNRYALLGMAREEMRRGKSDEALSLLARLVEYSPKFAPAHMLMAQLYDRAGESRKAKVSRALGAELGRYFEPPDPWMEEVLNRCYDMYRLTILAETARHAGRQERATFFLDRAATVAPGSPEVHTLRGLHALQTRDTEGAKKSFESAIRLAGHSTDAYLGLARVHLVRQDFSKAIQTAQMGLAEFPDSAKIHAVLGELHLQEDHTAQAERHLRISLREDPYQPKAIKSMANLLLKQGQEQDAMENFEEVRRLAPLDVYSRITLARFYTEKGDIDKAEAAFRELIELEPENPDLQKFMLDLLIEIGNRKAEAGRLATAVDYFREALALDPNRIEVNRSLALIHANLQEWDAAAENLKTYLDKRPDDAKTWVILGDVYWSARNLSEARARWRRAQRLAQNQNGAEELLDDINARLAQPPSTP